MDQRQLLPDCELAFERGRARREPVSYNLSRSAKHAARRLSRSGSKKPLDRGGCRFFRVRGGRRRGCRDRLVAYLQGLHIGSAHRRPSQCRLGGAVFVDRKETGADRVECIAQCTFTDIERKPQKSDHVAAKLPECQDVIGTLLIVSHTISRVGVSTKKLAQIVRRPQSARQSTFCNPTLTRSDGRSPAIHEGLAMACFYIQYCNDRSSPRSQVTRRRPVWIQRFARCFLELPRTRLNIIMTIIKTGARHLPCSFRGSR
ncbi:MAG: hypothetical protein QOI88_2105 [Gammaproteobacteria bacterium]|nr:hypothetical protein [Gammaproteobacteria bacterium]